MQAKDGNGVDVSSSALSNSNLADLAAQGSGLYLATSVSSDGKAGFLAGQDPTKTDGAKVYTFIAPKANGVVDLYYWLFVSAAVASARCGR